MGIRTQKVRRPVKKEETMFGKTHKWDDTEEIEIPRSLDDLIRAGMAITALALTVAVMVWSTASVGDLLSMIANPWVAYPVAFAIDAVWVVCVADEWLGRFQPKTSDLAKKLGWFFLAFAVAAITVHGGKAGAWVDPWSWVTGGLSALVSAGAKVAWLVVIRRFTPKLNKNAQRWVAEEAAEIESDRVIAQFSRTRDRERQRIELERAFPDSKPDASDRLNPAQLGAETQLTPAQPQVSRLSPPAETPLSLAKPVAEPVPVVAAETQLSQAKPAFGFSAGLSPQEAEKAKRVAETAKLMAEHPEYTIKQLAQELGYGESTIKSYRAEINKRAK